jgi:hypothetical protein
VLERVELCHVVLERVELCHVVLEPGRNGMASNIQWGQLLDLHAMKVDALLSTIAGASVVRWRWSLANKSLFRVRKNLAVVGCCV